jgi:hypothetical protein
MSIEVIELGSEKPFRHHEAQRTTAIEDMWTGFYTINALDWSIRSSGYASSIAFDDEVRRGSFVKRGIKPTGGDTG